MRFDTSPRQSRLLKAVCAMLLSCAVFDAHIAKGQLPPGSANGVAVNVVSYGADPSGNRDSTDAFVQAIASGSSVFVPRGQFKITRYDALVLNHQNQAITGAGRDVSLLTYSGPCQQGTDASHSVLTLQQSWESVRDIALTSRTSAKCIITGIKLNSDHGLAYNVAVSQMWHSGIGVHGSYNSVLYSDIEYNHFGIALTGDHQLVRGNYISNHWSKSGEPRPWTQKSMYWDGIAGDSLTNSVIDGNTVEDNGQSGIYTGGSPTPSIGNVITFNTVRHNRNEGIDQGVAGPVNRASNYVGNLVIVGNTSVDNFRRDIWLNQVDGAVVTNNQASYSPEFDRWWANDAHHPEDAPVPCQVWEVNKETSSNNIVFQNNSCHQINPSLPGLVFNPGTGKGNVLGENDVKGEVRVNSHMDSTRNVVLPKATKIEP